MLNDLILNAPSVGQMASVASMAIGTSLIGLSTYGLMNRNKQIENKICGYKELSDLMGDGILCSEHVRLSIAQSNQHILMLAPVGAGKSTSFMMPNINKLKKCSIVCTDPSGELARYCNPDKKVYILNPLRKDSIRFNPLDYCKSEFHVCNLANLMLTNGMNAYASQNSNQGDWVGMALPLLSGYMLMNWYTKKYTFAEMIVNICTVPTMPEESGRVNNEGKPLYYHSIFSEVMNSNVESAIKQMLAFKKVEKASGTLSSILTVMNTCLQVFLNENVQRILSDSDINFANIRKEESIIYVQVPERYSKYYSPLINTFFIQLFDCFLEEENKEGLQVYVLIDEFGNIGKIPDLSSLLGTIRKYNVSIVAATQSPIQLSTLYGETEGKGLMDLFKTILVCGGLVESSQYISDLIGVGNDKTNENSYNKSLLTASEVRLLGNRGKREMIILCSRKRPVRDYLLKNVV